MKPDTATTFDPSKLKLVRQVSRADVLFGLARIPGTAQTFFGSSDFQVYQADLDQENPEPQPVGRHESYVTTVAVAGEHVVSGSYDCQLSWWHPGNEQPVRTVAAHEKWIRMVDASPDGKLLASVGDDMVCRIWNAADGKLVHELRGHAPITPHHFPSMLYAVAFSPDGKLLATGDRTGVVILWDHEQGKELGRVDASGVYTWDPKQRRHSIGGIRSLSFSPDGDFLVVGGMGKVGNIDHPDAPGRLEIFRWRTAEQIAVLETDAKLKGMIEQLVWHPEGRWLLGAGGGYAGFFAFFDPAAGKILFQDSAPMHIHGLALSDQGDRIFAAGHNKLVEWHFTA